MNWFKKTKKTEELLTQKEELKDNIPCSDFTEAIGKGILTAKPIFQLNGVYYYTFASNLQMICANRYLAYQKDLQSWQAVGMNLEVSKDYINDAIEKVDAMLNDLDDPQLVRKRLDDLKVLLQTYNEHQTSFNLVGAMIEMNATAFIAACENPYVIDWDYHNKKIMDWGVALASEEGSEFVNFFWKLSQRPDLNWMNLLIQSTRHLVTPLELLTTEEIDQINRSRNLLIMEIYEQKKHLEDLRTSKNLKNHVKQLRVISNSLKVKWNEQIYSTIFNTKS